jgi:hypothetical protein
MITIVPLLRFLFIWYKNINIIRYLTRPGKVVLHTLSDRQSFGFFFTQVLTFFQRNGLFMLYFCVHHYLCSKHVNGCFMEETTSNPVRGRHCHDGMVVGFTTTCAISAYHLWSCEFKSRSWQGVLNATFCDKVCQWLVASW